MVGRLVWDQDLAGSIPVTSTKNRRQAVFLRQAFRLRAARRAPFLACAFDGAQYAQKQAVLVMHIAELRILRKKSPTVLEKCRKKGKFPLSP